MTAPNPGFFLEIIAPAAAPPTVPITVPLAALLQPFFFVAVVPEVLDEAADEDDELLEATLPEEEFFEVDFLLLTLRLTSSLRACSLSD